MKTSLIAGLNVQAKEEVKSSFSAGVAFRIQLAKVLEKKIKSNREASLSKESYETPAWAYLQADSVGYERALREVISTLDVEKLI